MMEPMNSITTGCRIQTGPNRKYWKHFGVLEIDARVVATMKDGTADRWRKEAPDGALFVPVVALSDFGADSVARWRRAMAVAARLGAETVLLHTSARFRPTVANRKALVRFMAAERPEDIAVAWWADGLWEGQPEDRDALCAEAGLLPAIDPLSLDDDEEPPPGERIYWRLMGRKGLVPRYTDYEITTLADLVADRTAGHVIFTAPTMLPDARRFAGFVKAFAGAFEELDDDDDDLDEDADDLESDALDDEPADD